MLFLALVDKIVHVEIHFFLEVAGVVESFRLLEYFLFFGFGFHMEFIAVKWFQSLLGYFAPSENSRVGLKKLLLCAFHFLNFLLQTVHLHL